MDFFSEYKALFLILHLLGFALGFGGALISDYLFFKFLKNLQLSNHEVYVLGLVSGVVWKGIFVLTLSGLSLFLSDPSYFINSSKFLTKMLVVAVIILNGIFLHFYIKPRLKRIDWTPHLDYKKRRVKRLAFAGGAISMTSWTLATILGALSSIPVTFATAALSYFVFLLLAVTGSQIVEFLFSLYIIPTKFR